MNSLTRVIAADYGKQALYHDHRGQSSVCGRSWS
jgi:hypothetical protein